MSDTEPPAHLAVLGGHYHLRRKLGEGAFGEVYEADHELLDQKFAVKVLKPEMCESAEARARFLDEARALIRFSHPNVVQLRHVGEHAGRLYLVMDYVAGETLGDLVQREGRLPEARALGIMRQVLAGLEAAHAAGIIHRDLKPANVLVEASGDGGDHVRVLDFGLSKLTSVSGSAAAHRSMTGTIVGTLAYMSPEQLQGERDIDKRSDVFAAGLMLHEMLAGHHPYPGDSGIVVAAKLLRDPVPAIDPDLPVSATTRAALATALQRDRDARYASVTTFAQALAGKGPPSDTSRITTIEEARQELARQEAAAAATPAAATSAPVGGKRTRWVPILLGVAVLGAGAFLALGKDDTPSRPPTQVGADQTQDAPAPEPNRPAAEAPAPVAPPAVDPGPTTPEPAQPEAPDPTPPESVDPGPADPGPAAPEPVAPEPVVPEPAQPEPVDPGPVEPAPVDPAVEAPGDAPPPETTADPTAALSPAECCSVAGEAYGERRFEDARRLYLKALLDDQALRETHVGALRGVAESYMADADATARRGDIPGALALLEEARAFLEKRLEVYGSAAMNVDAIRLEMGFTRMHLGEVHVEMARWLTVAGRADEAGTHLKPARDNFEFADPNLRRDGPRYAELLLRRASLERLENRLEAYWNDLSATTRLDNEEVPQQAWVAQARGARRLAQSWGAQGNRANASSWAQRAVQVARKGVSWKDDKLTRDEWLEMVRTLFTAGVWREPEEDPRALEGLARFWVDQAAKAPPPAGEDPRVTTARLKTAEAVRAYLAGISAPFAGKPEQAAAFLDAARELAREAVELRTAAAADGRELPDRYTFRVLAEIEAARGDTSASAAAQQEAGTADARNPD
ncbi:MAG: protein kinase [Planctomycetota bacterium]